MHLEQFQRRKHSNFSKSLFATFPSFSTLWPFHKVKINEFTENFPKKKIKGAKNANAQKSFKKKKKIKIFLRFSSQVPQVRFLLSDKSEKGRLHIKALSTQQLQSISLKEFAQLIVIVYYLHYLSIPLYTISCATSFRETVCKYIYQPSLVICAKFQDI